MNGNRPELYRDISCVSFIFPLISSRIKIINIFKILLILEKFHVSLFQLIHLDYDMNSNVDLDFPNNSYLIIANLFMLILDAFLYLVLALYFDKILLSK